MYAIPLQVPDILFLTYTAQINHITLTLYHVMFLNIYKG